MEIMLAFIIFGLAFAGLVSYLRKAFKEGDKCSSCSDESVSCGVGSKRGKCC
ncbi:MAG: hypothetical protein HQL21_09365 [Candidatus Omnitrophica bacterium]|nr:hypothetical protein [Candidatus Omnitrophota bacterium]